MLERGVPPEHATAALKHFAHREYPWLETPSFAGTLTVLDVLIPRDLDRYRAEVERWARAVWETWSIHRQTIARWVDGDLPNRTA